MSRKPELEFNNTCPIIDDGIGSIDTSIHNETESIVDTLMDRIENLEEDENLREVIDGILTDLAVNLSKGIEKELELVRNTNSDMRDKANDQIARLFDEYEEEKERANLLESQVEERDERIYDLEQELRDLKQVNESLEEELKELQS